MALDSLKKTFQYKVFDSSGTFKGIWPDVSSEWVYNRDINTAGGAVEVTLGRNSETTMGNLDALVTDAGTNLTTDALDNILLDLQTGQNIGPGTLVDINLEVQVYCFYGYLDPLTEDDGTTQITTTSLLTLDMEIGAPFGRRVFDGRITKFESFYGDQEKVIVTLSPFGTDMANYVLMNGGSTTKSYTNTDISQFVIDAIAMSPKLTTTADSVPMSGAQVDYSFKLFTLQEVMDKCLEFAPPEWSWWVDVAQNVVYFRPQSTVAQHVFVLGKHINNLNMTQSMENLANTVFVLGGDTGGGVYLYREYKGTDSINTYGQWLDRVKDQFILTTYQADVLGTSEVQSYRLPTYQSELVIPAFVYDIESISLGD